MKRTYGCFNRGPAPEKILVQDGWSEPKTLDHVDGEPLTFTRAPVMVEIPFVMSQDCRYDRSGSDPRCSGCKHGKQ